MVTILKDCYMNSMIGQQAWNILYMQVCEVRVMEGGLLKREEVMKALHQTKCRKVPEMDENAAEFLKKGDDSVVYWLISIFGECMDHGKVPQD